MPKNESKHQVKVLQKPISELERLKNELEAIKQNLEQNKANIQTAIESYSRVNFEGADNEYSETIEGSMLDAGEKYNKVKEKILKLDSIVDANRILGLWNEASPLDTETKKILDNLSLLLVQYNLRVYPTAVMEEGKSSQRYTLYPDSMVGAGSRKLNKKEGWVRGKAANSSGGTLKNMLIAGVVCAIIAPLFPLLLTGSIGGLVAGFTYAAIGFCAGFFGWGAKEQIANYKVCLKAKKEEKKQEVSNKREYFKSRLKAVQTRELELRDKGFAQCHDSRHPYGEPETAPLELVEEHMELQETEDAYEESRKEADSVVKNIKKNLDTPGCALSSVQPFSMFSSKDNGSASSSDLSNSSFRPN